MGKADFMSPKAIGNRIKSKGLQKLRWYCQVCEKQCRDENGFKCHTTSESHLRQMAIFGQNPHKVVDSYSQQLERDFLEHIAMSHRNTRVAAQLVYNEYIANKTHIHMNATKWSCLTEFIKDMALRGVVTIEDTPKGWFMVYKPKDAEETLRTAMNAKRERNGELAEERAEREMEAQLAKIARLEAKAGGGAGGEAAAELVREEGDAPLRLALAAPKPRAATAPLPVAADFAEPEEGGGAARGGRGAPPSALAEIMAADEAARDAAARRLDYWLFEGIVVKVMAKELAAQGYYKAKGAVTRVIDRYVAEVELADGGDVIRVDQAQLETVLPAPGGAVRVVRGAHRGALATLLGVDVDRFKARVRVRRGPADGRELELDYEDVCKLAPNAA